MLGLGASSTKPFVDAPLIPSPASHSDWPGANLANGHGTPKYRIFSPLHLELELELELSFRVDDDHDGDDGDDYHYLFHHHHSHHRDRSAISTTPPPTSPSPLPRPSPATSSPAFHPLPPQLLSIQPSLQPSLQPLLSREREHAAIPPQRGRLGGRADIVFPTDPQSSRAFPPSSDPASLDAPANPRLTTLSQQPRYPGAAIPSPDLAAAAAAASALDHQHQGPDHQHHQHHNHSHRYGLHHHSAKRPVPAGSTDTSFLHSPFRNRPASSSRRRRLSAARLWNPTNSTPRIHPSRRRRPSTPPPPSVPLQHPALDDSRNTTDPLGIGPSDYPLLTLPEQRQTKHSVSTRASLQIERSGSRDKRVSLPRSVRASYDGTPLRSHTSSVAESEAGPSRRPLQEGALDDVPGKLDKGKGKATMISPNDDRKRSYSRDLECGPDTMAPRRSNVSAGDGIGSAVSSSNSSIMGEDVQPDAAGEWGPQHPCYPHLNPHVPVDSAEYANTRIIRIRRDWLVEGDLAPTFSNLYPEILDPAGFTEQEFRRVIEKLNGELVPAFNPYSFRSLLDSTLGLVTGWLWDDFGLTGIKSRLNNLEKWIDKWNLEVEKTMGSEDGAMVPKLISLRRTGYMTLDIQIPDPEIAPAPSTNAGDSRTALPLELAPVRTPSR
ncbi:hypothetical protein G7046_g8025 [Stylonectria norvegica]|nr:hypothetical protein G7046_g8025 [Stylonectria norvegica]